MKNTSCSPYPSTLSERTEYIRESELATWRVVREDEVGRAGTENRVRDDVAGRTGRRKCLNRMAINKQSLKFEHVSIRTMRGLSLPGPVSPSENRSVQGDHLHSNTQFWPWTEVSPVAKPPCKSLGRRREKYFCNRNSRPVAKPPCKSLGRRIAPWAYGLESH